jgi:hypothetical protein
MCGFYKGGHDGQTANTVVCIEASQRCVVMLSNEVRSDLSLISPRSDLLVSAPQVAETSTFRRIDARF